MGNLEPGLIHRVARALEESISLEVTTRLAELEQKVEDQRAWVMRTIETFWNNLKDETRSILLSQEQDRRYVTEQSQQVGDLVKSLLAKKDVAPQITVQVPEQAAPQIRVEVPATRARRTRKSIEYDKETGRPKSIVEFEE